MAASEISFLGCGLGLRPEYFQAILSDQPDTVDWFEAVSEDYFSKMPAWRAYLLKVRAHYPVVLHGVSLSLGGTQPFDQAYLKELKALVSCVQPAWVSEHLSWSGGGEYHTHDLCPLPYTPAVVDHLVHRIGFVQDYLGRPLVLENITRYTHFQQDCMPEWEFIAAVLQRAGCYLLLDVNNLYINAQNHGYDPQVYLAALPSGKVKQVHLAGHQYCQSLYQDTHDAPIADAVWALYRAMLAHWGAVSVMIERDANFPPLSALLSELAQVRQLTLPYWPEKACHNSREEGTMR